MPSAAADAAAGASGLMTAPPGQTYRHSDPLDDATTDSVVRSSSGAIRAAPSAVVRGKIREILAVD